MLIVQILNIAALASGWLPSASVHAYASADIDDHIRATEQGEVRFSTPAARRAALPPALNPGTYAQLIDHTGLLPGQTFVQRYWVDSEYAAQPDTAPVILHICGEANCEGGYFLHDSALDWARVLGAHVVYLEHRYYGRSVPFGDLTSEHMPYLTLKNVIEDLASFERWIAATNHWQGKWISVGGSYSGTLSAIYRQVHPELVVGALAASAPMVSGVGEDSGDIEGADMLSYIDATNDSGERPWAYQSCTTFGFWLANGPTPSATLYEPSRELCQQVFGQDTPHFNPDNYNRDYSTPYLADAGGAPTNILFTYGTDDIWTTIGFTPASNQNPRILIHLIPGAGHHFDLNPASGSDSAEVLAARELFITQAKGWLGLK